MTPLQKVAMGMVIVVVDPPLLAVADAVPDVLGWLLLVFGLVQVRARLRMFSTLVVLAVVAAAISVALLWPSAPDALRPSGGWLLSLPTLAFAVVLCSQLAELALPTDPRAAKRFRVLGWVFVLLAVLPVLLYGGGVGALLVPTAVLAVSANLYLIYLLFKVSPQPYVQQPDT